MAEIHCTPSALTATVKTLLELADSPDDVAFTHGPRGPMIIVSDALADKLVAATAEDPVSVTEVVAPAAPAQPVPVATAPVKPGPPVELEKPAPAPAPPKVNPRARA